MGAFNLLGNMAGGYADSRNAKKAAAAAKPAQGTGGAPVMSDGTTPQVTTGPNPAPKTLGQKIDSGLLSAGKNILGFKHGGRITKSGIAYLHKGEKIVSASKERKPLRMSSRKTSRR